jgi:hypothetical protein
MSFSAPDGSSAPVSHLGKSILIYPVGTFRQIPPVARQVLEDTLGLHIAGEHRAFATLNCLGPILIGLE